MTEVRKATYEEVQAFYGAQLTHYIAKKDDIVLGVAAINQIDGQLWAYLDLAQGLTRGQQLAAVRAILSGLHTINRTLHVICNNQVFARAERLMTFLGFEPTDEVRNGMRVWTWQNWQQ